MPTQFFVEHSQIKIAATKVEYTFSLVSSNFSLKYYAFGDRNKCNQNGSLVYHALYKDIVLTLSFLQKQRWRGIINYPIQ